MYEYIWSILRIIYFYNHIHVLKHFTNKLLHIPIATFIQGCARGLRKGVMAESVGDR